MLRALEQKTDGWNPAYKVTRNGVGGMSMSVRVRTARFAVGQAKSSA